jgi:adenine-specific DNA methylase
MADQAEKLKDEAEGFNCWVSFAYKAECHISRHERLEILLFACSSLFFQKTSSCEKMLTNFKGNNSIASFGATMHLFSSRSKQLFRRKATA